MSDKHPVRTGIIATVLGGIILAILQRIWPPVRTLLSWLWHLVTSPVTIPLALFVVLILAPFMVLLLRRRHGPIAPLRADAESVSEQVQSDRLAAFETSILQRIAKEDGEPVYHETLARSLKTTRIRLQAGIDRLVQLKLIEVWGDYENDDQILLTAQGRRYVVDHEIA